MGDHDCNLQSRYLNTISICTFLDLFVTCFSMNEKRQNHSANICPRFNPYLILTQNSHEKVRHFTNCSLFSKYVPDVQNILSILGLTFLFNLSVIKYSSIKSTRETILILYDFCVIQVRQIFF